MLVNFKRNFFDGESRWRSVNNPHDMPDEMKSVLPSDAEILSESKPERTKKSAK